MIDIKRFRPKILDLAVRGKLVRQDPRDESAAALLEKIRREKERLIKSGQIKREKELPAIEEDEIPFEIPERWEWVRLGEICNYGQCKNIEPTEISQNLWILELEDIEKDTGRILQRKNGNTYKATSTKHLFKKDYVLFSKLRTYLKKVIVADCNGCSTSEILPLDLGEINPYFIKYCLVSSYFVLYANQCSFGVKMPRLGTDDGKKALIPLPPLAEQRRIVEKAEEIFSVLDRMEKAQSELNVLSDRAKTKILDLAVRGRLVPQVPGDQPAAELLAQIRQEKERLVKSGQIKREKELPPIDQDEIPFEIPKSWEWVRLGTCLDVRDGTHDSPKYLNSGYPLVTSKNLNHGKVDTSNIQYISEEDFNAINKRSKVETGNILFAMIGSIGNPAIIGPKHNFAIKNVALFKTIAHTLDEKYIYYYLYLAQFNMRKNVTGGLQPFVSLKYLRNYPIPLPPLAEQRRIVEKVESLLKPLSAFDKSSPALENSFSPD